MEETSRKCLAAIRAAYVVLTPMVMLALYLDPLKSRPSLAGADLLFLIFFALSAADLIGMRVIALGVPKRYISPTENAAQAHSPHALPIAIGAVGLSPLIYAVVYYLIGGGVGRALILSAFTILCYIHLSVLLPRLEAAGASDVEESRNVERR